MKRSHARDAFDAEIVRRAVLFTAVLFQPRGATIRREFGTLAEAISAAGEMRDDFGRTGLVYAVTAEGREAEVPRRDWPRWLRQPKG